MTIPREMPTVLGYTSVTWRDVYVEDLPSGPAELAGKTREHFFSYCQHLGVKDILRSSDLTTLTSRLKRANYDISKVYGNYYPHFYMEKSKFQTRDSETYARVEATVRAGRTKAKAAVQAKQHGERIKKLAHLAEEWCSYPSKYVIARTAQWDRLLKERDDLLKVVPSGSQHRAALERTAAKISVKQARVESVAETTRSAVDASMKKLEDDFLALAKETLGPSRIKEWERSKERYERAVTGYDRRPGRRWCRDSAVVLASGVQDERIRNLQRAVDSKREFERVAKEKPTGVAYGIMERLRPEFESSGLTAGAPKEIGYRATLKSMEQSLAACKQRLPVWEQQRLAKEAAPQAVNAVRNAVRTGHTTRANSAPASTHNSQPARRVAYAPMTWDIPIGQGFPVPLDAYTANSIRADYRNWDIPLAKAFYAYCYLNREGCNTDTIHLDTLVYSGSYDVVLTAVERFHVMDPQAALREFERAFIMAYPDWT
ncbi:hypothetical protein [Streptomyces sp. NBC_01264]|uniref:hypothetical protein n=1 Tax=Streptomyces sp. NBC_01264 TaxID=2903804 RepID=UPI002259D4E6|nr:hypothetical protein [Streptomyces sp. NBC_01264]MCX4784174.1 hypothetical protein [Streptomyces sp. NBC_01264]